LFASVDATTIQVSLKIKKKREIEKQKL